MRRGWALTGSMLLAGCAGHPPAAFTRAQAQSSSPTQLEYVIYASLADSDMLLPLVAYPTPGVAPSKVAVQLQ